MLDRDEQMQPGFVGFENLAQGFGFASRDDICLAREFQKPIRWDFPRAVTQGWIIKYLFHENLCSITF